ncbi:MAG TPA: ACT domain-containing protein [Anaerolineaceae bacterium]|nr:ACT domain-containing protein [Anaerolineaceae bacterium]
MNLRISVSSEKLAICSLPPDATIPRWIFLLPFWSITRTGEETSLILPEDKIPAGWKSESGWRALKVEGPLDFSLTGILESIAAPLAKAGISIFAVSTFDTDYVLVKDERLEQARKALADAGFEVIENPKADRESND